MIKLKSILEDINSRYLYHVTAKKNLENIKTNGLIPTMPPVMSDEKAVYLFKDRIEAEDAIVNWLDRKFDEDEPLVILTISPVGLNLVPSSVEYEILSYNTIPWKNVVKIEDI